MGVLTGDGEDEEHPFYQQSKNFINENPLPYQEISTRHSSFCSLLVNDFLNLSVERCHEKLEDAYNRAVYVCDLRELFRSICGHLGSEEPMEQLNLLFRQRFIIATAMQIYLQGIMFLKIIKCVSKTRKAVAIKFGGLFSLYRLQPFHLEYTTYSFALTPRERPPALCA